MNNIAYNLKQVRKKIAIAAIRCNSSPEKIKLIAVSKNKTVDDIAEAIEAGQLAFGENYVQEGVKKINYFRNIGVIGLQWHFIGYLQSNKSRFVAKYFDWCHTVDRLHIAIRLNEQRPIEMAPLNILIQSNISNESSKSGVALTMLTELADEITVLPHLKLRGLMAIPALESNYAHQFSVAKQASTAFLMLKARYSTVDTLSLGMSQDMEPAIAAGSNMVRIGTAIFGSRHHF